MNTAVTRKGPASEAIEWGVKLFCEASAKDCQEKACHVAGLEPRYLLLFRVSQASAPYFHIRTMPMLPRSTGDRLAWLVTLLTRYLAGGDYIHVRVFIILRLERVAITAAIILIKTSPVYGYDLTFKRILFSYTVRAHSVHMVMICIERVAAWTSPTQNKPNHQCSSMKSSLSSTATSTQIWHCCSPPTPSLCKEIHQHPCCA